ncbi:ABC transporter ATP-binding protein [Eubacterium multiforme]|uniref:Iron complex transport system ATP-binding protein n=1 Tax=Eubacterium multiforme TaxID=83339 RepID=A0ABT9URH1_9FIRM|nr:ABC transporter ATP-binding protein [Eubacterium multiforme]MDQ0148981.1 iron complex transport system ATP-binding protein [Eubacterium multiforme]
MIEVKNVYTGYNKINIIKDISFKVNKNELFCIIGPNGCGKSTLLKAIANINDYKGSIKIFNKEIKDFNRKDLAKNIALMSQITEIYFSYTVYDTISLGRYSHINGAFSTLSLDDKIIVENVIKDLSLTNIKDKYISELSGGQLQRVFLARTIVQDPKVILLDEPTNHLDFKHQIELLDNIKKWCKAGDRAVIGVLHDLNLVNLYADRVALIDNGKIVDIDYSENILKSKKLEDVYGINIREFMLKVLEKWN